MSSDEMQGIPEEVMVPPRRSSFWDVLYAGRKQIAVVIGLVAAYLVYHYWQEEVSAFLSEYWPIIAGPILGWYFAKWVVANLYRPTGRYIAVLDTEHHTFRTVYIPEQIFCQMEQSGNNVVYHTLSGFPLYIARGIDLNEGTVDYGWVHELDSLVVMTREDAFNKWDETLNEVLEENLELMSHPHIIGLGYARKSLRDHLDGLAEAMGFKDMDYGQHTVARQPAEENLDSEEEVE